MFKIVKSNIPHLPDWLFKRPNLNHNSITSSFSNLVEIPTLQTSGNQKNSGILDRPKALGTFPLEI